MFEASVVRRLVGELRAQLASFEAGVFSGADAATLVSLFDEGERLCAGGKTLALRRVDETRVWAASGHRSAATWLADTTKSSLGETIKTAETGRRLGSCASVEDSARSGSLSASQLNAVAKAAEMNPEAGPALVELAPCSSVKELQTRCRELLASRPTPDLRQRRYLRTWSEADGCLRLDGRFAPIDGAKLLAVLQKQTNAEFAAARREGRRERGDAYRADACCRWRRARQQ